MAKIDIMEIHGTELGGLKPGNVLQAAGADLERKTGNKIAHGNYAQYAFHRKHVRKANSVAELIRNALADPTIGIVSGKKNTRLIYRGINVLEAAAELAARELQNVQTGVDTPAQQVR